MNSTISRSGGAKVDTWCALVATRAKNIPPGEKKTFYLCSAVMQQSSYEWKLMSIYAIPRVTLLKSKNFVQNYCRSVTGNDHKQKYDTTRRKLCVPRGAAQTKIYSVSILERRVSYRKIRKIWTFADSWKVA